MSLFGTIKKTKSKREKQVPVKGRRILRPMITNELMLPEVTQKALLLILMAVPKTHKYPCYVSIKPSAANWINIQLKDPQDVKITALEEIVENLKILSGDDYNSNHKAVGQY